MDSAPFFCNHNDKSAIRVMRWDLCDAQVANLQQEAARKLMQPDAPSSWLPF